MTAEAGPRAPAAAAGEVELSLYRPNVGVVLFNPQGKVWLGRRCNTPGPHNWQFPQGGVDQGEDLFQAALRELKEETGVVSVGWLGRTRDWITYDFPEGYKGAKIARGWRGQKQVWFALRFSGEDAEVDLNADRHVEFDAWRWAELEETAGLVIPFKRPTYQQVAEAFRRFTDPGASPDPGP
jgi:putative (di)nucleoside polyphosphate hydrolase